MDASGRRCVSACRGSREDRGELARTYRSGARRAHAGRGVGGLDRPRVDENAPRKMRPQEAASRRKSPEPPRSSSTGSRSSSDSVTPSSTSPATARSPCSPPARSRAETSRSALGARGSAACCPPPGEAAELSNERRRKKRALRQPGGMVLRSARKGEQRTGAWGGRPSARRSVRDVSQCVCRAPHHGGAARNCGPR